MVFLFVGDFLQDKGGYFSGMVYNMLSAVVNQLLYAAESPADTDALDLGIAGCLHVDSRVAYIYGICA